MADIRQTNRTLVLDSFNPEMLDILTLVGETKGIDSLSDETIKKINQELLVSSFDEFLEKFNPTVYSFYDANSQSVKYTLKKPERLADNLITEIPLNMHNDFFKMLCTLLDTKRSQGIKNVDFKFESILDMITPKKVMDDIRQIRKELQYNYSEYDRLPEGDPKKLDMADKLNVMFEEASENYNNVLAMLPLAIEDCKARLLLGGGEGSGQNEKIAVGVLKMGEDGELKVLEAPKVDETALALVDNNSNQGLIEALEDDYEALNGDESSNYVKALVVRSFCPLPSVSLQEIDVEKEVSNHNAYLNFYTQAKSDFIKCVKPLIEKMLGVREYFGQYSGVKGKGMRPTLLIANAVPEMMAKSSNLPRIHTFLNTVNNKNDYDSTIWFAVYPNLSMDKRDDVKVRRERFKGNQKVENTDVNSMESLTALMACLEKYSVKTFFSFETREETTFNRIATDGIEFFMDRCEPLVDKQFSAYAVPCLPNITVVPKDKSGVITGNRMVSVDGEYAQLSKEQEDIMRLWIEGVYISASYVAAGIVSACQCPEYLRDRFGKNVHPEMPGVRYDIEAGNNAWVTKTTFAKEIAGFTGSVKAEINTRNFGFILASENAKFNGKMIDQITVYKARSLATSNNSFEPIFQTQVETYFDRIFRQATGDYKQDNIKTFFSANPKSQMSQWLAKKEFINAIIQIGDEIKYNIDEESGMCDIELVFNGASKNMRVQLQRSTAGRTA